MGMPPAKKKTSPIVWVLVIVLGLFVLGGIGVVGVGYFFLHKIKQAGLDPELMRTNPGLAVSKFVSAVNPDLDVLDHNDRAGTITVRDRKTGKVVTMTFDQAKSGKFNMQVEEGGKTSTLEFGGNAKFPSWIPAYPGASLQGNFAARTSGNNGEGGTFTFTTSDPADKVRSFYEDKAKDRNMQVETSTSSGYGSVLTLTDTSDHKLTVTIMGTGSPTTVLVAYSSK
jgi:hypothetical protein